LRNNAGLAMGIKLRSWEEALADFLKETGYCL